MRTAKDWEGMAEAVKDFLIERLNDSADIHELRFHFNKYCEYKTNAAFERNGGNVNNDNI